MAGAHAKGARGGGWPPMSEVDYYVPVRLPPVDFELGIITGDASLNSLFSWWLPGQDDGLVPVASARVEGADDFLVVPYSHTFIMHRSRVIEEVLTFLETGSFADAEGT